MKRFLTFLKNEGKLSVRCPDGILFGICMPVGVLFLIAVIAREKQAVEGLTYLQSAFASLLTVGICATAFMGLPLTIADYRGKKILKHFFVTPVRPLFLLWVQVVIAMLTAIVSAIIVAISAVIFFDYHMEGNLLVFMAAYLLVMLSMYAIGMVIASVCSSVKTANIVTTFVYFPMLFLSGATIPYEVFPKAMQMAANALPLTHGIKLLKAISIHQYDDTLWISIVLLLVCMLIGCLLSLRLFRWE